MKAMKAAIPLAKWFLRFALITFILSTFLNKVQTWQFTDVNYLIGLGFVISSVLLVVGGFMYSSSLTVVSGILVFLLSLFRIVLIYLETKNFSNDMVIYLFPLAIGFYFFARGNQG